jgi:ribose/xylose/arabinose/galactoside ABC-type transport system permease subunit
VGIQPIVATLILMTSGRGIAQLITEGRILTFSDASLCVSGLRHGLRRAVPDALVDRDGDHRRHA